MNRIDSYSDAELEHIIKETTEVIKFEADYLVQAFLLGGIINAKRELNRRHKKDVV